MAIVIFVSLVYSMCAPANPKIAHPWHVPHAFMALLGAEISKGNAPTGEV
jgi:hypothetical protein